MKPTFDLVLELENGMVHIKPRAGMDQVTLCGITDWLGKARGGRDVKRRQVTCQPCRWIADYCQAHQSLPPLHKPKKTRHRRGSSGRICTYPDCECPISWGGEGPVPITVCPKEPER